MKGYRLTFLELLASFTGGFAWRRYLTLNKTNSNLGFTTIRTNGDYKTRIPASILWLICMVCASMVFMTESIFPGDLTLMGQEGRNFIACNSERKAIPLSSRTSTSRHIVTWWMFSSRKSVVVNRLKGCRVVVYRLIFLLPVMFVNLNYQVRVIAQHEGMTTWRFQGILSFFLSCALTLVCWVAKRNAYPCKSLVPGYL